MADNKPNKLLEREYVIPLRRFWLNVPQYERTGKAIKAIKSFIAKHMKVPDRDVNYVKLDIYLNNELWFRGRANPPSKVRVKATKEGDIVNVNFVEVPAHIKFLKAKNEKIHKKSDTKVLAPAKEEKKTDAEEKKIEEQKKEESEKEKSVEVSNIKEAEQAAKIQKHTTAVKEPKINRMALKK